MKQALSPKVTIAILVAIGIVVVGFAFSMFGPSLSSGPAVKPRKFAPPSGYDPRAVGGPKPGQYGAPKTDADKGG